MATKTELEAEIERLKTTIRTQERAVEILSKDAGVVIEFPHAKHGIESHLMFDGDGHKCHDAILSLVWDIVHAHGIPYGTPGISSRGHLTFKGWTSGARFVVPSLAAEMIAALINRIADYGAAMHRTGYAEGTRHLRGLATGAVSPDDYEQQMAVAQKRGTSKRGMEVAAW